MIFGYTLMTDVSVGESHMHSLVEKIQYPTVTMRVNQCEMASRNWYAL